MPTTLTNGIQLPDKGSVDWYSSMQSNYNLIDTHLGDTDVHVTAEDKANWNSKQGSLSQAQLDAIAQVATNTSDIATLQSGKANVSHTHSSSDITDIDDYATKDYVDNSISGLVDNAPDALNTLNELSTALNDDANFASTVTTALAAKANSADLATVATTGSYTDLDDKPTINDSTITIQKNGSTVDTFTTNGSNKTINILVPTKTSDLTNDSNFVDTSNSAVASGITSAKVTDYDTHIADTDIHVTTADKNRWNNNTYVLRYSSTTLTASSTNSNSLLDNTDNLKVGDKVIDSSGVLFSVTAIDTANSTFTIGTALIDLLSSDLFNSANTWTGNNEFSAPCKTLGKKLLTNITDLDDAYYNGEVCEFTPNTLHNPIGDYGNVLTINNAVNTPDNIYSSWITQIATNAGGGYLGVRNRSNGSAWTSWARILTEDHAVPTVTNTYDLGTSTNKWKAVYATNYYYGSNNVEFSDKFVTSDTAQTISGTKTFDSNTYVYNSDNTATTPALILKNSKTSKGSTSEIGGQLFRFFDKNNNLLSEIESTVTSNGASELRLSSNTLDSNNQNVKTGLTLISNKNGLKRFCPTDDGNVSCGYSTLKWSGVYATNYYYGNDNVEFSTKFVTTDTNQTISGSKTFEGVDLKLKSVAGEYTVSSGNTSLLFYDKNSLLLSLYKLGIYGSGIPYQSFNIVGYDSNNQQVNKSISFSSSYLNLSTAFLKPDTDNAIALGRSNAKWSDVQTNKVNGLTPSSLGMPATTGTVDISGYVTDLTGNTVNTYSPVVNGYIVITCNSTDVDYIKISNNLDFVSVVDNTNNQFTSGLLGVWQPCVAGIGVQIRIKASALNSARFIPCQGNI